jgi:multiple antibiotic resistance protein
MTKRADRKNHRPANGHDTGTRCAALPSRAMPPILRPASVPPAAAPRLWIAPGAYLPTISGMIELVEKFLKAFIPLFVAMDPIGLAALYLCFTPLIPAGKRKRITRQAIFTGAGVALLFLFLGRAIFRALYITPGDFQIAGGLILLILAARDLLASGDATPQALSEDFGVVPLGMPLIAGPAVIATMFICVDQAGLVMTLVALAANLALVLIALAWSEKLGKLIGVTGMKAISKIISMLLAAIAIAMIRQGLKS